MNDLRRTRGEIQRRPFFDFGKISGRRGDVHVAVDQARHQHATAQVDGAIGRVVDVAGRAYLGNPAIVDEDRAIGNECAALGVQDRGVFEDDSHAETRAMPTD